MIFFTIAILFCAVCTLVRAVSVTGLCDRVLALNMFNTCVVLMIVMMGALLDIGEYLIDISLMYACVGLVYSIGFARFFLYGGWDK